jgi:hypothetical protein
VGEDGFHLLDALDAPEAPEGLRELPILATLRQTWHIRLNLRVAPNEEL